MEVHAITKNVRMSAQKMREVVRQIQGMPALKAQAVLSFMPGKRATVVAKTLKSAIANAENNNSLKPEALVIKQAVAGTNLVLLEPDVARAFPDSSSVNRALRLLQEVATKSSKRSRRSVSSRRRAPG